MPKEEKEMLSTGGKYCKMMLILKLCLLPPQSVENAVCVLRNLSYRLYDEMPPSSLQRLEGQRRNDGATMTSELVGCFSPQGKKAREVRHDVKQWHGHHDTHSVGCVIPERRRQKAHEQGDLENGGA